MERIGELIETLSFKTPTHSPTEHSSDSSPKQFSEQIPNQISAEPSSPPLIDGPISLAGIWSEVRKKLEKEIGLQLASAWISPLELRNIEKSSSNGSADEKSAKNPEFVASIVCPNRFCSDHVQRNYSESIRAALCELGYKPVALAFQLDKSPREKRTSQKFVSGTRRRLETEASAQGSQRRDGDSCLNPKYNFSNFVVGSCNQLAHAVGLKISEDLGSAYNPLFLYGGVGLGKTHLANAIGNSARRRQKKVLLVSSEAFVSELIASLRSNRMDQFKNKFRSLDLLIIDDIQFIIGKERTQEEFFHTFNDLYNRHKQIVITSDKVPQELVGLEDRLKTRFASGLSVDLQAPDFETRVAILSKKAEVESVELPEEVTRLIAERIDTNVRELEGALNQLRAFSSLQKTRITLGLAEEVLKNFGKRRTLDISSEAIQRAVAERFNVSFNDLLGKRRTQNIALARQVAMYLCRKLTAYSFPEIGAFFGGRDHSTVIHAQKIVTDRISSDPQMRNEIQSLEKQFRNF